MSLIRQPFRYRQFNAALWLIGINIVIFAAMNLLGLRRLVTIFFSMSPGLVISEGWVWTFVTYMFVHGSITHVLFNMLSLYIFGTQVERYIGSREFLLFYFVT